MLTICISPRTQHLTDATGHTALVRQAFAYGEDGIRRLQDLEPSLEFTDVQVAYVRSRYPKLLPLPEGVKAAVLAFMRKYHGREDMAFDCYAFANLVRGVRPHKVRELLLHWRLRTLPRRPVAGTVVFLTSGCDHFHHAAVYLGSGLYLSVWGAGGTFEVATLKDMMRDFGATKPRAAHPLHAAPT